MQNAQEPGAAEPQAPEPEAADPAPQLDTEETQVRLPEFSDCKQAVKRAILQDHIAQPAEIDEEEEKEA